ncbi:MAG: hypothetical protein ACKOAS_08355 [Verrucomicrobiota bacterium]
MPRFERYIGIDYSGAGTPLTRSKALRVYAAERGSVPQEIPPPKKAGRHWSRREIAEWLAEELAKETPMLVGIDHGFSFPMEYFQRHGLPLDWPAFLEDFHKHWPTDGDETCVAEVRQGLGAKRDGDSKWLRLTERWTASAKSVFQFDVQGQVATSTHAGLPWLRFLRNRCGSRIHFWPFDGWEVAAGRSMVAEIYPSLWMRRFERADRDPDQQAAYATAASLQQADLNGSLAFFLNPPLTEAERKTANVEGWILGVA